MGPIGHCAVGLAAKPAAPRVPLGILFLAALFLDVLAVTFGYAGIESAGAAPWSHGLFMSLVWSVAAGVLIARVYRQPRAGFVIGLVVFSHWVLDFISHPIPFASFSWSKWQWDYGHRLPSDLPLLFTGWPVVGLGLYNRISAVEATALEVAMFAAGAVVYARGVARSRKKSTA